LLRLDWLLSTGSAGFCPSGRYEPATAWTWLRASFSPGVDVPLQPASSTSKLNITKVFIGKEIH